MRKCNMVIPRDVVKAVLLLMPVISIFFLWWVFFLVDIISIMCEYACLSYLGNKLT